MKNSELQIVVISFSYDFTKNSESLITTPSIILFGDLFIDNKNELTDHSDSLLITFRNLILAKFTRCI